jgi:hypothetical protein
VPSKAAISVFFTDGTEEVAITLDGSTTGANLEALLPVGFNSTALDNFEGGIVLGGPGTIIFDVDKFCSDLVTDFIDARLISDFVPDFDRELSDLAFLNLLTRVVISMLLTFSFVPFVNWVYPFCVQNVQSTI